MECHFDADSLIMRRGLVPVVFMANKIPSSSTSYYYY